MISETEHATKTEQNIPRYSADGRLIPIIKKKIVKETINPVTTNLKPAADDLKPAADDKKPTVDDMDISIIKDDVKKPDDNDTLITKTDAKQKYLLKDDDFIGLHYEAKQSKKYKHVTMQLFVLSEVKARAYEIWKDQASLDKELDKRRKRKIELASKRLSKSSVRRNELEAALNKHGLHIRPDSKLCHGYINGTLKDWSLDEVVDMCRQMNWLYTHTNYAQRLHYDIQGEYEYKGRCDVEEISNDLRCEIIKEHGGGKPWLAMP